MYLWPVKLTPKQGVFGPLSFLWIFFSVFMLLNDLCSNFTDPLQKQISIKQDTFWTNTQKGRRTWTANFDFAMSMNFDWLNNLFSFPVGLKGNFAKTRWCLSVQQINNLGHPCGKWRFFQKNVCQLWGN